MNSNSLSLIRDSSSSPSSSSPLLASLSKTLTTFLRSLITIPTCRWVALPIPTQPRRPSLGRKVTGTLFGHRKGHVNFAVQDHPGADPVLLMELPISTSGLVKEMSSGLVRIALECDNKATTTGSVRSRRLYNEPVWTMYCNGRKCEYRPAMSRAWSEVDMHVLRTVQSVSVGAGVIPAEDGNSGDELVYMRARFERMVGSPNSEAFYMLNPDANANTGPDLTIFLLRL